MKRWAFAMMAAAAPLLIGAADGQPTLPGWMAGCWEQRVDDRWTEECWTSARGGVMLGASRSGAADTVREWEAMQILLDQRSEDGTAIPMAFYAAPGGRDRTRFTWSAEAGPGVTFRNAAHDYPQRVHYRVEGDELVAEISMSDGSKPMRWRYRRK